MSETKFTPGPWRTVRPSDNPTKLYVRDCGGLIAEGPFPSHYEGQDERFAKEVDQYEANARLIAAAPELYEALDQILDDMGNDGLSCCQAAKDQARAALAKARGETP